MNKPLIAILLATYNGECYLKVQLDSILAQSYDNWLLLISDDGSSDSTTAILNDYASRDSRIKIIESGTKGVKINANFSKLLQATPSECDFVAFCDQDDFWLPEKIMVMLEALPDNHHKKPYMLTSDRMTADQELQLTSDSAFALDRRYPKNLAMSRLLLQNAFSGNAMLINRRLLEIAQYQIPSEALWYDHYLVLLAVLTGELQVIPEALLIHRRHGNNASIGNSQINFRDNLKRKIRQAQSLMHIDETLCNPENRQIVSTLALWNQHSRMQKLKFLLKYRYQLGSGRLFWPLLFV